jgi:hypothetical protein
MMARSTTELDHATRVWGVPEPRTPVLLANPSVNPTVGKTAAVIASVCVLAHVPLLIGHFSQFPKTTLLMLAMSCACIPCARRLWLDPRTQDCTTAGALAAVMVGLHVTLAFEMASIEHGDIATLPEPLHRHLATASTAANIVPQSHQGMMHHPAQVAFYLGTGLALLQVVMSSAAVTAAVRRHRHREHQSHWSQGYLAARRMQPQ